MPLEIVCVVHVNNSKSFCIAISPDHTVYSRYGDEILYTGRSAYHGKQKELYYYSSY